MSRREQFSVGGEFTINGEKLTVTAAKLNALGTVQTELTATAALQAKQIISEAGGIDLSAKYVAISKGTGDSFAVTLAAPTAAQAGETKVVEMVLCTANAVTLALTNVVGGTEAVLATFDAVGETLVLVASGTKWVVLKEQGVTLTGAS